MASRKHPATAVAPDSEKVSAIALRKRAAILQAAIALFRRYGFRKTSIDQIADAAHVAKPTVYAHFADKDALFVAVCDAVMEQVLSATESARRANERTEERLAAMIAAKFTYIFEVVHASPHAAELLDSQGSIAASVVANADARYAAMLRAEVTRAAKNGEIHLGHGAPSTQDVVSMLLQAGHGAAYGAKTAEEHRKNVARLVGAIWRGVSVAR